jgi:hypothetical protein
LSARVAVWALALGLVPGAALAACPPAASEGRALAAGAVQLAWRVDGEAPIVVGKHFALRLQVCPADARLDKVDASMPEHRHGMNYRPSLQALGGGLYRAEGLMFHMAGRWELQFDVQAGGRSERLRDSLVLQ